MASATLSRVPCSQKASDLALTCKLLGDETRLSVIEFLQGGRQHVTAICDALGQSQPAVSHHLALLRVAGIIVGDRKGKHIYYTLNAERWGEVTESLCSIGFGDEARKIRTENLLITRR